MSHTLELKIPSLSDARTLITTAADTIVGHVTKNPVTDAVSKVKERIAAPTEDQLMIIALHKQVRILKGQVTRYKNRLAEYEG